MDDIYLNQHASRTSSSETEERFLCRCWLPFACLPACHLWLLEVFVFKNNGSFFKKKNPLFHSCTFLASQKC